MWSLYFKPFSLFNPSSVYWFSILFIHWMILNFHSQMFIFPPLVFYLFILWLSKQLILKRAIPIKIHVGKDYLDLWKANFFIFISPIFPQNNGLFFEFKKKGNRYRHRKKQWIKLKNVILFSDFVLVVAYKDWFISYKEQKNICSYHLNYNSMKNNYENFLFNF